jgi:coatomer subunit beta'
VCGDGEYIIYTALALKNKSFGQALEFAWAQDSGSYATRESTSRVKGVLASFFFFFFHFF